MGSPVNGGNALFMVNGNGLTNVTVNNGVATATYTAGSGPSDSIQVNYQGVSGQYNPSSGSATEQIQDPVQNTVTNVTTSPNPAAPGQTVTITASVQTTP